MIQVVAGISLAVQAIALLYILLTVKPLPAPRPKFYNLAVYSLCLAAGVSVGAAFAKYF